MKKNYLFGLISLFTVLFMASCQEEDVYGGASDANTGMVTFKVNTQQVGTRAADATGKGDLAKNLYYGVYEYVKGDVKEEWEWHLVETISKIAADKAQPISSDGTVVNIRLAKQKKYSVIFWAQSDSTMFTVDWANHKIDVKSPIYANAEGYDAFWACDTVTLTGALSREINLVRPFAQLNIGISNADLEAAQKASVDVVSSAVTVRGVPTSMDLMGGTVADAAVDNADDAVTYSLNAIPNSAEWTFPVSGYQYLALNYVLVGRDKSLTNVELSYKDSEGLTYSNVFTDVPVRRNYRTNIYGDLLTNDADYSVKIDGKLSDDDNNVDDNTDGVSRSSVSTVEELQEAIDNAKQGETNIISFENDINASTTRAASVATIIIPQTEGINFVIDGRGYKFDGTITVDGNGRSTGAEILTFKNIKFSTASTEGFTFINAPSKITLPNGTERYNYSHNITIEDCSFEYVGDAGVEIGSASFTGTYNLVMKNCIATNMHSALQVQSCDNTAYVENVKAINCKNGISFGNTAEPTLKNSEINTREYGVRGDGDASRGNLVVENTVITAKTPLIVRKLKTNGYNVSLIGTNTLTSSDNGYQIVFTKDSDDKPYEEPTVNYTISGITKGLKMFPEREKLHEASGLYYNGNDANWKSVFYLYDAEDLVKAAEYFVNQTNTSEANGVTFELKNDINLAGTRWTPWSVMWITLNGNNHTISNVNVTEGWRSGLFGYLGAAKVNDLTLENVTVAGAQVGVLAGSVEGVTTNNVTIKGNNSVSYKPYESTEYTETWGGFGAVTGVVANSTINATIAEGATVVLNDNAIETQATFRNFLSGYLQENKGTIVNNGIVTVDGKIAAGLESALANAASCSTIELSKNADLGAVTVGELKDVTIKGAEGATMIFKTTADTKIENVKLENVNFEYTGATLDCGIVIDANAQIEDLVIDGCTVTGTGAKAGRGLSGHNNNASIVIKNTTFKDLGYPIYAWGGYNSLTIENCTFDNIKSWAIMPQSGFNGNLTVTGCTFKDCLGGGLIKAGTLTAGHTFTFTNNTITGCTIAGDHNWFQFNVSAGTSVVSGNTKDGVGWTPTAADGLK